MDAVGEKDKTRSRQTNEYVDCSSELDHLLGTSQTTRIPLSSLYVGPLIIILDLLITDIHTELSDIRWQRLSPSAVKYLLHYGVQVQFTPFLPSNVSDDFLSLALLIIS